MADEETRAEQTTPPATCAGCGGDISDLFEWTKTSTGWNANGGGAEWYFDYFGDGKVHPPEDFPAPRPLASHGARATRNGSVIHSCGTWAA